MTPLSNATPAPLWRRLLPLAALLGAGVLVFTLGLDRYLSFDALAENRARLLVWTADNGGLAIALYVLVYIGVVALSLPGGVVATLTGGFLFGTLVGGIATVFAATIGACLLFLIARTALGEPLRAKAGPALRKLEAGFRDNALSYLLVLRLVPLFPFFLVNLAPAFLGVSLRTYAIGTFFGIMPGTFVFASVGAGMGAVLDQGGRPDLGIIFAPEVLLPLLGLAALALVPVVYRKFGKGRA